MKKFNITGTCIPHLHYMVNIDSKVQKVIELINEGLYFVVSRPRQYGKTTLLSVLYRELSKSDQYIIIKTSFEGLGDSKFKDDESFCGTIFETFADGYLSANDEEREKLRMHGKGLKTIEDVSRAITQYTKQVNKKVILIIDEVDRASNFNLFIHFLGMLRDKYLKRADGVETTFHSIILAGLHDIKNIKLKMRPDSESAFNSPWNIATEFKVDMSFSAEEIETMLVDYAKEIHAIETQNISNLSYQIYKYTSGYPFLVSKVCKLIEEELGRDWSIRGIQNAIALVLKERNTLFDDLIKNIENYTEIRDILHALLVDGKVYGFNIDNPIIDRGVMYGIFKNSQSDKLVVHNKIFEIRIYNYLASKLELSNAMQDEYTFQDSYLDSSGNLNMEHVLLKFQEFIKNTYSEKDKEFYERHGRLLLIAFIKPIINGSGFYYLESQQSYERRSDMIITFNKIEYILELKLWYGEKYHQDGLRQLAGYLESRNHDTGYLVAFNFNQNKEFTSKWNDISGKKIFEVIV